MAEQPGFLEQLTGSSVDENALYHAQVGDDIKAGGRIAQMMYGLGKQAAGGLGVAAAGIFGKGQEASDGLVAQASGISPEELRSRRRVRKETSSVVNDGSFSSRRKMAEIAARIANEEGDSAGLGRALQALQSLKAEEAEWNKLQASTKRAEADALGAQTVNAWDSTGQSYTGIRELDENGVPGLRTTVDGKLVHMPYGPNFNEVDPTESKAGESLDVRLSRLSSKEDRSKIRTLTVGATMGLRKADRILSTLVDLADKGGVGSVIGWSGGLVANIDNLSRNINGVIDAFKPTKEGKIKDKDNHTRWITEATKGADWVEEYIKLPEGVARTSAAAQQHRANVMEMAYMAARLAEPSNRGLSDNDIKNALMRIAGDTSNPQVMMRKFLELQTDAQHELDAMLKTFHGSLGPLILDEDINKTLAGNGYDAYITEKKSLFEKYGAAEGDDGRVTFSELIGTDVQPGEGIKTPEVDMSLSDDDFLKQFLGE